MWQSPSVKVVPVLFLSWGFYLVVCSYKVTSVVSLIRDILLRTAALQIGLTNL